MKLFGAICLVVAGATYFLLLLHMLRHYSEKRRLDGFKAGYEKGFADAVNRSEMWWHVAENEVSEERQKIWREEGWP